MPAKKFQHKILSKSFKTEDNVLAGKLQEENKKIKNKSFNP
jgi:hypothetical protein